MLCFSSLACWGTSAHPGGLAPPCLFPWSLPSTPQMPGCKSPGGSRLPMWTNGTSRQIPAWHPRPSCQGPSLTWHGQLLLLGPRPFFPVKWLCSWDTAWGLPTAPGAAVTLRKQEGQSSGGGQFHSSSRPAHNLQMSVLSPVHLHPKGPPGPQEVWPYIEMGSLQTQLVKTRSFWSRVGLIRHDSCPSKKWRHGHRATDTEERGHVLKKAGIRVRSSVATGATRSSEGRKDPPLEPAEWGVIAVLDATCQLTGATGDEHTWEHLRIQVKAPAAPSPGVGRHVQLPRLLCGPLAT